MSSSVVLREHALRTESILRYQQARAALLQSQLQALQSDLLTCTSAAQHATTALAKSECTHLCALLMTRLPRELRDMVYQHLVPSSQRISREYFRSTMHPITRLQIHDAKTWKAAQYPEHYWDVEYVGAAFAHELVQMYFRTSTFVFGDDEGLIERFLSTDQMGVGYTPAELVARVEVCLNAMTYDRTTCVGYMFGCATKPERLRAALRGVEGLKVGARVCVYFETRAKDGEQREEQIRTVWEAVGPCLRELRERGCAVRLVVDGKDDIGIDDVSRKNMERSVDGSDLENEVKV